MAGPAAGGAPRPVAPPNVFGQSANWLTQAGQMAGGAGGYKPMQVQPGQIGQTNLSPYMNPYQGQVIDAAIGDMNRARDMAMNDLGAQASAAGAFGGSRQGVAEAETNRAFAEQAGQMAAGLRAQGFQNAQGMAGQDIATRMQAQMANQGAGLSAAGLGMQGAGQLGNLANLGFGMGQQITGQQAQQGALQQGMMQSIIDAARGRFEGFTGQPGQSLSYPLAAVSGVPYGQTQTTRQQPGLFNYLSMFLGGL